MIIVYDEELTVQRFVEDSAVLKSLKIAVPVDGQCVLGEIDNPAVAWDQQRVASLPNGKLISYLFGLPEVPNVSFYDDTANQWFKLKGTWPVTIDTLTHLRGQKNSDCLKTAEKIIDVGCGNGGAGIYAVNRNEGIKSVTFSDLQESAVETAKRNAMQFLHRPVIGSVAVADCLPLDGEKYDVILASAVPATPGYSGLQRSLNPLLEGTTFLERLLRDASQSLVSGGKLLISHSSCGEPEFDDMAKKYGAKVDNILYERQNAYRVEFLGDQKWVDFLVERGGLNKKQDRGFDYWHTVRVKEVSYS